MILKVIENLDNITDDYRGYIQKIITLQAIQQVFKEMLVGGKKIVNSDIFFQSLISGQMFKMIFQSLKGYFMKWRQRKPLLSKRCVTLMGMVREKYELCLHT